MDNARVVPCNLEYKILEEMTNGFSEERKLGSGTYGKVYMGEDKDGGKIAVKMLYDMPSVGDNDKQFDKEFQNLISLQHHNIVRLVSYCHETQRKCAEYDGRIILAEVTKRALCFEYMQNGSLDNFLSDEHSGLDWQTRYTIIKGICKGLQYLHEDLKPPVFHLDLKPANILLDANMIPKIADFGLSRLFGEEQTLITTSNIGTLGYLPPEYINRHVISNKLDIFSLGVVIVKIITGRKGYSQSAEMPSQEFIELVCGNWRNRLRAAPVDALDSYCKQVKRCIQIALSCVEFDRHSRPTIGDIVNRLNETESMIQSPDELGNDIGSSMEQMRLGTSNTSEWLDIHPLKLHFPFEPNKLISRPLRLTNKTYSDHVAFRCLPETPEAYLNGLSQLHGILPPRTSCTYVVSMKMQQEQPVEMDALAVILENCVAHKDMNASDVDDSFFMGVREENGGKVHEVKLIAVCEPLTKNMASEEPLHPRIEIMYSRGSYGSLLSVDVHPIEPWIMAGHDDGYVSIWNYQSQEIVVTKRVIKNPGNMYMGYEWIPTTKFIARKQWFVAGGGTGCIYVYSYATMGKIKEFKAHTGWVESVAIHPSDPFMLSASDDRLIKLWDWESGWKCIRTFKSHSHNVQQVMLNPHNDNTFASVSKDGTIKIWSTLSPDPVATMVCRGEEQICVDYLSTGCDLQHMVTGSSRGIVRIWDLKTLKCTRQLRGHLRDWGCSVAVVDGKDHPILTTVSSDYAVSLCNSTAYRHESTFHFKLGRVRGLTHIKATRSLVVGFEDGIAVMEII